MANRRVARAWLEGCAYREAAMESRPTFWVLGIAMMVRVIFLFLLNGPCRDQFVNFFHQAHGLFQGDDDFLVVEEVVKR